MISVIIPTKNEEKYLPKVLDSINAQNTGVLGLEVIVADAHSTDRTREIATQYGCRVIDGGHPGEGRNSGAKASKGDILVFQDADTILPPNFLRSALSDFYRRGLEIAGTSITPIPTGKKFNDLFYRVMYDLTSRSFKGAQDTKKPLMQSCMFARKRVHEKMGGFDETLEFGEDSDYAQRAVEMGYKFGILETPGGVLISPRKFEEGGIGALLKNGYFLVGMLLGHEFRRGEGKAKYF